VLLAISPLLKIVSGLCFQDLNEAELHRAGPNNADPQGAETRHPAGADLQFMLAGRRSSKGLKTIQTLRDAPWTPRLSAAAAH
jgi:hypothetical protein